MSEAQTSRAETLIEIEESSGPISPRYRYELELVIARDAHGVVTARFARRGAGGDTNAQATLDAARLAALYDALVGAGIERCTDDLVPARVVANVAQRSGASVNHVCVRRAADGATAAIDTRFHYVSADLGADDALHAPHRAVIATLKTFASELA